MRTLRTLASAFLLIVTPLLFTSCADSLGAANLPKAGNLGSQPSPAVRAAQIANEPRGNFYYARRYFVNKTRFWGYVRKPGQSWQRSKLVLMDESSRRVPDRLPETGVGKRYGYDQNYEYRVTGNYTGSKGYDPNSNSFFPIFRPTSFSLLNKEPGWIFSPRDYYDPKIITLRAR